MAAGIVGDISRAADWAALFDRELSERAAVRLLCQFQPEEQLLPYHLAAKRSRDDIRARFGTQETGAPPLSSPDQTEADVVAEAVELGDEHAIKLAEVAVRHNSLSPNERYAAASLAATNQLRRFP